MKLYGAIRHPSEPRVLLLRSDRAWGLPRAVAHDTWFADAKKAAGAFAGRLGTTPWLLRQLAFDDDSAVLELETPDEGWKPPAHARWAGEDELGRIRLRDEAHRALLAAYLREGLPPAERAPWARRGWRERALAWLEVEVARLGRRLVAVEQVKHWSISTILRIRTDGAPLYLKASAKLPLFVDEGAVTAALAARFADAVPAPLAVHPEEGWLLLADFGDPVGWSAPLETRAEMLARFARLQRESAAHVDELLAAGCLDRRLPVLARQLDRLVARADEIRGLTDDERAELRRRLPELKDVCRRLGKLGLPATLVHGDLHLGNVARPGRDLLFFDWTDACVAHPFIDLQSLQWEREEANREALLDAYLAEWEGVVAPERLHEAARVAAVVTPLHHAVSYQTIADNVERSGRAELDAAHEFLRVALARL